MELLTKLKGNLPILLLVSIVPYFFYASPGLPQAIIATAVGALAGYKYYLEAQEQPDYVKIFKTRIDEDRSILEQHISENKVEIQKLREKQLGVQIQKNGEHRFNLGGWTNG